VSVGGVLPWALLVVGSAASLAANVAVAEQTATGRVIAAWPSFALIAAYELLMRQIRRSAAAGGKPEDAKAGRRISRPEGRDENVEHLGRHPSSPNRHGERSGGPGAGRDLQRQAWQWAQAKCAQDGSLPTGRAIAREYGRHERWGRLVKRSGVSGEFVGDSESGESSFRLVEQWLPPAAATGSSARRSLTEIDG
jgi:hypothetical protein